MGARLEDRPDWLREALAALAARLRWRWGPRLLEVRLLGSWARGEGGAESDVDVCVVLDTFSFAERREGLAGAGGGAR